MKLVAGFIFGSSGFLLLILGLIGVIDPVGTKMADDPDPFGPTDGIITTGIVIMFVGLALIAGSGYILWRIDKSETNYWIRLLQKSDYLNEKLAVSLISDCDEIQRMLTSSIRTAKVNLEKGK